MAHDHNPPLGLQSQPLEQRADALRRAVAARPIRVDAAAEALIDRRPDAAALAELAAQASAAADPIDDKRGTRAYRSRVAGVLARRAAEEALRRASGRRAAGNPAS